MTGDSDVPDVDILSASEVDEAVEDGEEAVDAVTVNDVSEEDERRAELKKKRASGEITESEFCEHELLMNSVDLAEIPDEPTFDDIEALTGYPSEDFETSFETLKERRDE